MRLFCRTFGEGEPIIILHGLFGISDNWVSIGRRLAKNYKVYIPDLRNHGHSPHSDTFNYFAMVDDVIEFIEDNEIENPIIIGHSMGGKVSMNLALENPELLKKLIVVDISTRHYPPRQVHLNMIKAMQKVDLNNIEGRKDVDKQLKGSVTDLRTRQFVLKNLYRLNDSTYRWRINLDVIAENIDYVFEGVSSSDLFLKPTLFIKGGKSDYILEEDYDMIYRNFPQAAIKTIAEASHWVHADAPDDLCKLLNEFLGQSC